MARAGGIEIPITLGGVKEVRQQIKNLRGELINATDPAEVARLSENIGQLSDKLKDANEKAQVFASDSKFEQTSNAFGLMKSQLASLDFQGAGESAALFANRIKSINPAEFGTQIKGLMGVVGNLSKAFISMGASLLMNPIFLIAAAIAGIIAIIGILLNKLGFLKPILDGIGWVFGKIGEAIDWVIQQIKDFLDWLGLTNYAEQEAANVAAEAAEKKADAWESYSKRRTVAIDHAIRMDELDGKNTTELELKKQFLIQQTAKERVKALNARFKAMMTSGDYDEEEIKKLREELRGQMDIYKQSVNEGQYIRKKDKKDREKDEKEASDKSIDNAKNEAKARTDAYKKYKEDRKAIEREIQDLIIDGMIEGEEKERAQINEKYKRAIEDVKTNEKYLKAERTKIIQLLNDEQANELKAIEDAKHQEELERKRQQAVELATAESQAKADILAQLELIENAREDATLSQQDREINAVRDKYFTLIQEATKYGYDVTAIEAQQQQEIDKIKQDAADKDMERQKKLNAEKVEAVRGGLQAIGGLAEAWAGKDKERQKKAFKVQKAANIATATIDTYKGATAAFASAGNPILGAVFAALVIAAGVANIMKIKNTQFDAGGGGTPSASTSSAAVPQSVQPTFAFQGSGNNANNLNSQNDLSNITVKAVVSETEITSAQQKVSKYQDNAVL